MYMLRGFTGDGEFWQFSVSSEVGSYEGVHTVLLFIPTYHCVAESSRELCTEQ